MNNPVQELFIERQLDLECRPFVAGFDRDAAAMRDDNLMDDCEAETRAFFLCCKKRQVDFVLYVFRNAMTGIGKT